MTSISHPLEYLLEKGSLARVRASLTGFVALDSMKLS